MLYGVLTAEISRRSVWIIRSRYGMPSLDGISLLSQILPLYGQWLFRPTATLSPGLARMRSCTCGTFLLKYLSLPIPARSILEGFGAWLSHPTGSISPLETMLGMCRFGTPLTD